MACQYAELFGKPNEGVHKHRIGGLATVDLLGTIGGAAILAALYTKKHSQGFISSFIVIFIILILLGIMLHKLFCVNTKLNSIIFNEPWQATQKK